MLEVEANGAVFAIGSFAPEELVVLVQLAGLVAEVQREVAVFVECERRTGCTILIIYGIEGLSLFVGQLRFAREGGYTALFGKLSALMLKSVCWPFLTSNTVKASSAVQ